MDGFEVHIDALAHGGAGVGREAGGKAVFVPDTAPGDTVRARLVADKGTYAHAELVELVEEGQERVEPACPLAGRCGGCHWQHVSYSAQTAAKRNTVVASLERIAHIKGAQDIVGECVGSKRTLGYRNKLELSCTRDHAGRLVLGMHAPHSDAVVPVASCPLAHRASSKAPAALQGALRYLEGTSDLGIFRVGVRQSLRTGACEVALWTHPGPFPRAAVAKTLSSALDTSSIVRVVAEESAARKVKSVEVLAGTGNWTEEISGREMRVSAPSFFQVNTAQAEELLRIVTGGIGISDGAFVADLYAGVGTFTLPLAARGCEVAAVESSGPAVRDLRRNVERFGLSVEVVGGDAARELGGLGHIDALVVDPPRAGLSPAMRKALADAAPESIAYVSCDAASWARDVAALCEEGYRIVSAVPVDLFPQTYHVEVASILARR